VLGRAGAVGIGLRRFALCSPVCCLCDSATTLTKCGHLRHVVADIDAAGGIAHAAVRADMAI